MVRGGEKSHEEGGREQVEGHGGVQKLPRGGAVVVPKEERDQAVSEFDRREGDGGGAKRRRHSQGPRVRIGVGIHGHLRLTEDRFPCINLTGLRGKRHC